MNRHRKMRLLVFTLVTILLFPILIYAQSDLPWYKGIIMVKFTDHAMQSLDVKIVNDVALTGIASVDALNKQFATREIERAFQPAGKFEARHRQFGLHRWYKFNFPPDTEVEDLTHLYSADANIEIAELHYRIALVDGKKGESGRSTNQSQIFPNDPQFPNQWHYNSSSDIDIDLPEAWDIETGDTSVIVSMMDTGTDLDHPDLIANLWTNKDEIPGNGIDDDNNGYIDDIHGWNFDEWNNNPDDYEGHGTHTAGTVAAVTNNSLGVAGVAGGFGNNDGARLMICRVLGPGGGSTHNAYIYAADNGSVISSNSWGYQDPGVFPQLVKNAIDYFIANAGSFPGSPMQGGVVVCSAGNNGANEIHYPSYYAPTIAVAWTTQTDQKASDSNFGPWVDISAPGSAVRSTIIGGYGDLQGTSMACPHVSGVLALIAAHSPGISNTNARALVEFGTDNIDAANPSYIGMLGSGRLNAHYALQVPAYLQGSITDSATGTSLDQVTIVEQVSGSSFITDSTGAYDFKIFGEGTHQLTLGRFAYLNETNDVVLNPPGVPGEIQSMVMDFQMQKSPLASIAGSILDSLTAAPIQAGIQIFAITDKSGVPQGVLVDTTTDVSGNYSVLIPSMEDYFILVTPEAPYPVVTATVEDLPPAGFALDFSLNPADILLVNDDTTAANETFYHEALDTLGVSHFTWHVGEDGIPDANAYALFPDPKTVIWFTGNAATAVLSDPEQQSLASFLDDGGRLLLTGQNIAETSSNGTLLSNYLGVSFNTNITPPIIRGVAGDAIGDGLVLSSVGGAGNQNSKDAILMTGNADSVLFYGTSTPLGLAALRVEDASAGWKAVFTGFGLEGLNNADGNRDLLLRRILDWFGVVTDIKDEPGTIASIPETFELRQNYPNPFNPETTIEFAVPVAAKVQIKIFNLLGQEVRELVNGNHTAGIHRVIWDSRNEAGVKVPSGVYFYRMSTETGFNSVKKLLLLK